MPTRSRLRAQRLTTWRLLLGVLHKEAIYQPRCSFNGVSCFPSLYLPTRYVKEQLRPLLVFPFPVVADSLEIEWLVACSSRSSVVGLRLALGFVGVSMRKLALDHQNTHDVKEHGHKVVSGLI